MQKLMSSSYKLGRGLKSILKAWGHLLFVVVLLSSCASPPRLLPFIYRGDGDFVTYGYMSGKYQYNLNLGRVDDKSDNTSITFNVGTLPRTDLALGFTTPVGREKLDSGMFSNKSVVGVQLLDAKTGDIIIDASGPLDEWSWSRLPNESRIFGYGLNKANFYKEPFLKENTRFIPKRNQKFTLIFEMIERDPNGSELYLKIWGGGFFN